MSEVIAVDVLAVARVQAEMLRIEDQFKGYNRNDRGIPDHAIPGIPYPTTSGALRNVVGSYVYDCSYGFTTTYLVHTGLMIGSDFAWPEGVRRADLESWKRGREAQKQVEDMVRAEAEPILNRAVEEHGGCVVMIHGSHHSVMGWGEISPRR